MPSEEPNRRQTRSQLVDSEKEASRPEIPSQNYLDVPPLQSQIDSSKVKEPKQFPTRKSNWNKKEKIKYLVFLNYYSQLPYWGSELKSIPTYKSLHEFVKSRSPEQCKSFHLSTRRNYKSIDQEIKALQEELEVEEGYQKMIDRYELEIIGFEEEHGILKKYELAEKDYFHNKLEQNCKETGYKKKESIPESPQENQPEYNSRINIKDFTKEVKQQQKQEKPQHNDLFQPLINMQEYNMPEQNYLKGGVSTRQKMPGLMGSNPHQPSAGMFRHEGSFEGTEKSKAMDKMHMESMRMQGSNTQGPAYGSRNIPNERMMPEGMGRMMEPNRSVYGQYPNYPYGSSPFPDLNEMQFASFRNQMPYSIPPPGGISYMMQGYHNPYSMGNVPSRYRQKIDEHGDKEKGESLDKGRIQKMDSNEQKAFNESRKQLLLKTHQHWMNWHRSATELERRRQQSASLVNQ